MIGILVIAGPNADPQHVKQMKEKLQKVHEQFADWEQRDLPPDAPGEISAGFPECGQKKAPGKKPGAFSKL